MFITRFREDLIDIVLNVFKQLDVNYYDPILPPAKVNSSCEKFITHFGREDRERILLRQFINFNQKYLNPKNWNIKISSSLTGYNSQPYGHLIDFFIEKAKNAEKLEGFLSKKSIFAYDEDNLLNCWSLHHVHLSNELEDGSAFYKRSDLLLMIHQSNDTLYLIDVIPHNDKGLEPRSGKEVGLTFSRTKVIEALIREFPEVSSPWKINGILGVKDKMDDFDHRAARLSGLLTMIEVDGSVYSPGFGISTASTSIKTTMHTDSYMRMIYAWEDHIDSHYESILEGLGMKPDISRPALFRLVLNEAGFIVFEARSNSYLLSMSERKYFRQGTIGER